MKAKRYDEGGDVPKGGRFAEDDSDIYRRARAAVERKMLDEQFPAQYDENMGRTAASKKRATSTPKAVKYSGEEAASDFVREVRPGRRGPGYKPERSAEARAMRKMDDVGKGFKKGGKIDGIAQRGKTRGRYI